MIGNDARYQRNKQVVSAEAQELLATKRVLVAGCGGIGGYVIEALARFGVGHLTVVDGDVFDETNLNRQLLSATSTLGKSKAQTAFARVADINPLVEVTPVGELITADNAAQLLEGIDVAVDALDNTAARAVLLSAAAQVGIPAVHASIAGWSVRVAVCMPQDEAVRVIAAQEGVGLEKRLGNPSFTAATAGMIEAAQVAKILLDRPELEHGVLLEYDLLRNTLDKIDVR